MSDAASADMATADIATPPTRPGAGTRLAVVGPTFFSYIQTIVGEFERRGIAVLSFDEKHSNRVVDKVLYRLGLGHNRLSPLPRYLQRMAQAIVAAGCTDVLLTGVEVIDRAFVDALVRSGVRVHFYTWDGVANKSRFLTYLDLLEGRSTFDPSDCKTYAMDYIPLFGEPMFDEQRLSHAVDHEYDIGFCGTVHSSRARVFATLSTAHWAQNLKLRLMLYYHSTRLFALKALVSRDARRLMPLVSQRSFAKAAIADMFFKSRYVLDVPHPGQSGMTARTFEVLLAGSRLLTTNPSARTLLPASLADRVTVIDDIDDVAVIDFAVAGRMPPLSRDQRYFLSLERFVDQLLAMMRIDAPAPSA